MSAEMASVGTEFDISAPKPVPEAVQETVEITYKPIVTIDETDWNLVFRQVPKHIQAQIYKFMSADK
jgi:hypothetical protein